MNALPIQKLKNKHTGETCFVVGTGPSLNETDIELLNGRIVFGANALYKSGVKCDYYAIADGKVYRAHIDNLISLDCVLFVDHNAYMIESDKKELLDRRTLPTVFVGGKPTKIWEANTFLKDPSKGFFGGGTVIASLCLPLAYYMGFSKVCLVGIDCDYTQGHRFDGSETENPSGLAGGIYSDEHWGIVFQVYDIFKREFELDGREIINCTVGGKLEVFKRKSLEEVCDSLDMSQSD